MAVTAGTTNEDALRAFRAAENVGRLVVGATTPTLSMVTDGQADAFATDDVLLYGLIAGAGREAPTTCSERQPVLRALRHHVPQGRSRLRGGRDRDLQPARRNPREIRWIYEKWFIKRLPNGRRLNIPMSEQLLGLFQMMGLPD